MSAQEIEEELSAQKGRFSVSLRRKATSLIIAFVDGSKIGHMNLISPACGKD